MPENSAQLHLAWTTYPAEYQSSYNALGILWSGREEPEKSLEWLTKAENVYNAVAPSLPDPVDPASTTSLVPTKVSSDDPTSPSSQDPSKRLRKMLESSYTLTMYYMAQIHGSLDNAERSAWYCAVTLKRQLETGAYNAIAWAGNASSLASYYMSINHWEQAEHCLGAARKVLAGFIPSNEDEADSLKETEGSIFLVYGALYTAFMRAAKANLNPDSLPEGSEAEGQQQSPSTPSKANPASLNPPPTPATPAVSSDPMEMLSPPAAPSHLPGETPLPSTNPDTISLSEVRFEGLSVPPPKLPKNLPTLYRDACVVVVEGLRWLKQAEKMMPLDGFVSSYITNMQYQSSLHRFLSDFEPTMNGKTRCYRKRIAALEPLMTALSVTHYFNELRDISFELGETYNAIFNQQDSDPGTKSGRGLLDHLETARCTIKWFGYFIDTFKNIDTKIPLAADAPKAIENGMELPVLTAYFYKARMLSRLSSASSGKESVEFINEAAHDYNWIAVYAEKHDVNDQFGAEVGISREFAQLLPLQAKMLETKLSNQ